MNGRVFSASLVFVVMLSTTTSLGCSDPVDVVGTLLNDGGVDRDAARCDVQSALATQGLTLEWPVVGDTCAIPRGWFEKLAGPPTYLAADKLMMSWVLRGPISIFAPPSPEICVTTDGLGWYVLPMDTDFEAALCSRLCERAARIIAAEVQTGCALLVTGSDSGQPDPRLPPQPPR